MKEEISDFFNKQSNKVKAKIRAMAVKKAEELSNWISKWWLSGIFWYGESISGVEERSKLAGWGNFMKILVIILLHSEQNDS